MSYYKLFVPKQAVGANLVYFDLFNASGSPYKIEIVSLQPVVSGAVAVTGTLAVDLHLTRTSAVGTGGTAATTNGTAVNAMTFTCWDGDQVLDLTSITARLTPTGGATAAAHLSWRSVFSEETNAGTYTPAVDMANIRGAPCPIINPNSGFRVIQGAVASVGNIGFDILLRLIDRS